VMEAGVPEGAGVGQVLAWLETEWAESDFAADETALRENLARLVASEAWKT
jgi:hypothetical protein